MPRVVHFELPADDPDRAVRFYERAFGWKIEKWDGPEDYWLVTTGDSGQPGINGAITRRSSFPVICNTLDVSSVDEYVQKVVDSGGEVAMPKMAVPGIGWLAYAKDPEGNLFGMMQADREAR
jgi:predicted enzyme related to lactoylglutathione lyase